MTTPPSGPTGGDEGSNQGSGWGPDQGANQGQGADDATMWMPPADPSAWESPVDDTGLFPGPFDPPAAGPAGPPAVPDPSQAPTVAFPAAAPPAYPDPFAPPATAVFDPASYDPATYDPAAGQDPYTQDPYAQPDPYDPFAPPAASPAPGAGFPEPTRPAVPVGATTVDARKPTTGIWVAAGVLGVLVAVGLGVVVALMGSDDDADKSTAAQPTGTAAAPSGTSASASPSASASVTTTLPKETAKPRIVQGSIDAKSASAWVRNAGGKPQGEVDAAYQFSDVNGTNVLLLTEEVTHRYDDADSLDTPTASATASGTPSPTETSDALPNAVTSRIYLVAARDGADPTLLRTMTDDNGGICENDFTAEFAPNSVTMTDTDGDGIAEVTVGWYSACRGDPGPMSVKLALLSGKKKFILRGEGLPAGIEDLQRYRDDFGVPPVEFDAEPGRSSWPKGGYEQALKVANQVYK